MRAAGRGPRAAAVNYPDVLLVAGEYQVKLPVPFVPGSEYAGIVTEVARPRVGDRVAAAFGVAHRTAYHVLCSVACPESGEELVVLDVSASQWPDRAGTTTST